MSSLEISLVVPMLAAICNIGINSLMWLEVGVRKTVGYINVYEGLALKEYS